MCRRAVTADTDLRLVFYVGFSESFSARLQTDYELMEWLAEDRDRLKAIRLGAE